MSRDNFNNKLLMAIGRHIGMALRMFIMIGITYFVMWACGAGGDSGELREPAVVIGILVAAITAVGK